jgi:hypothetical protein
LPPFAERNVDALGTRCASSSEKSKGRSQGLIMEFRTVIFCLALLAVFGSIAELYVRANRIGENVEKIKGVVVRKKPRLMPPLALLIASLIVAVVTFPR